MYKKLIVALLAVFAFGAVATSNAFAALEFVAKNLGTRLLLAGKTIKTQKFKVTTGTVSCTTLLAMGTVTAMQTAVQAALVEYRGDCEGFGTDFNEPIIAEYEFNANGKVKVLKPITIESTKGATVCKVTVPTQEVSTVEYKDLLGGALELVPKVTDIESEGSGSACAYAKEAKGTYTGTSEVILGGSGEIEVN